jgi:hypothetical protein
LRATAWALIRGQLRGAGAGEREAAVLVHAGARDLLAPAEARLDEGRVQAGEAQARVAPQFPDLVDGLVVVKQVGGWPIAGGVREVRSAGLDEPRVEVGPRAVEDPAHARRLDGEVAAVTRAATDAVEADHAVVVQLKRAEAVLRAEVEVALAVEEIGHLRLQRDGRGGDRAHLRHAVGVARDDARRGPGHGVLVAGEGAEVVAEAEALKGVVEDVVQRELGVLGEPVVELQVETRLLAVVVIVLGTEVPEVGGRRGGVLEVARGAEEADRLLAVE